MPELPELPKVPDPLRSLRDAVDAHATATQASVDAGKQLRAERDAQPIPEQAS